MTSSSQNIDDSHAVGKMSQQSDAAGAAQAIRKSSAQEMEQIVQTKLAGVDLPTLAEQLAVLRAAMRDEPDGPDRDIAIGSIAQAEKAAELGQPSKVAEYLKTAGRWALEVAEKIGVGVAVVAIRAVIGI